MRIEEYCKDAALARKPAIGVRACVPPSGSTSRLASVGVMDLLAGDECVVDLPDPATELAAQLGVSTEQFEEPIDLDTTERILDETVEGMDLEIGGPIESGNDSEAERKKQQLRHNIFFALVVILLQASRFQINHEF